MKDIDFYKNYYGKIISAERTLSANVCDLYEHLNNMHDGPIVEHMISRIKTAESAKNKLKRNGYEPTAENAVKELSDVIGIRLIVHFIGDIYILRDCIVNSNKFTIIKEKDYVKKAKPTGYRGYHIIVQMEVDGVKLNAEIQLRTIAMDCWASLEHRIRYKRGLENIDLINGELLKCSSDLLSADIVMEQIWNMVNAAESPRHDE